MHHWSDVNTRPDLPLKFVGGDPGVDLVNTVDWTADGLENERLTDYERLTRWAEGAGVISAAEGRRLRRAAESRPREAAEAREEALRLRSVLQRVFSSVASGERDEAAWEAFNVRLGSALERLRLSPPPAAHGEARGDDVGRAEDRSEGDGPTVDAREIDGSEGPPTAAWRWRGTDERLDWFLWPVVRSAAELLASDEARRIQICDGSDCGWIFVDRSRNRLRRWCEMETCGTAAKTRRRRERRKRGAELR